MSLEDIFVSATKRKKLNLVSHSKLNGAVTASIEAKTDSEALSYFKGRFGMLGRIKLETPEHYVIEGKV